MFVTLQSLVEALLNALGFPADEGLVNAEQFAVIGEHGYVIDEVRSLLFIAIMSSQNWNSYCETSSSVTNERCSDRTNESLGGSAGSPEGHHYDASRILNSEAEYSIDREAIPSLVVDVQGPHTGTDRDRSVDSAIRRRSVYAPLLCVVFSDLCALLF